jgi:tRNA threonylcarbamoyladenosine biosynthesis protein TsaB
MSFLVIDTSGRHGSIALARALTGGVEVIELVSLEGGTFSAELVPKVAALLKQRHVIKSDVEVFVIVSGPGSFTGLRIGLTVVKGLAEVLKKPIVPVSLLEAVALGGDGNGNVIAAIDAGRGEIYIGEYEITGNTANRITEQLASKEQFVSAATGKTVVTSDAALATLAREAGISVSLIDAVNAGTLAGLGWRKFQSGCTVAPDQLEANYIRRTDAEILAKLAPSS